MHIAFFGSSLLSAWCNGAATYYRGLIRALHDRGHRITFYEPDTLGRQAHCDMQPPDWAEVVVYADGQAAVHEMLARARASDVVIKASGVGVHDELLEACVPELKRRDNLIVFWDGDAPATLARLNDDVCDPLHAQIPRYDLVLTCGGGPLVVDGYERLGARRCVPIYNAFDPATHHPQPVRNAGAVDPAADLVFIGNRLPDREARVQSFFVDVARQCPDKRFLLGGDGWVRDELPANVRLLGPVYTRDHNAANSNARCVLDISRAGIAHFGYSPAARLFEAAAAGACIITDAWLGIEDFFVPDDEILIADSGADVAGILDCLTPVQAREIGTAALARVRADHTYARRAAETEWLLMAHLPGRARRRAAS